MLNVSCVANVYDGTSNRIDCWYQVTYYGRDKITPVEQTYHKPATFNVGDLTQLGVDGTLKIGDILTIEFWQGDEDKSNVIRSGTKYLRYDGRNTIVFDAVLDENKNLDNVVNVANAYEEYTFTNTVSGDYTMEQSVWLVSVMPTDMYVESNDGNWKLLEVIEQSDVELVLTFLKTGIYKVECYTVCEDKETRLALVIVDVETVGESVQYIEWE